MLPLFLMVMEDGLRKDISQEQWDMCRSKVVEDMLYVVDELGVKYFTVYAFSTENWKRSTEEVSTLMGILRTYLKDCVKKSMKNNVRCRVIGRKDELSQDIIDSINNLEENQE